MDGLQKLLSEPTRLTQEAEKVNDELEDLVKDHYRVFIENLTCNAHLQSEGKKLKDITSDLTRRMDSMSLACTQFKDQVQPSIHAYKRNRKSLQHHIRLLDLLELPQVVESCIRNEFYDEALELASFVNGLERRHLVASEVKPIEKENATKHQDVIERLVRSVFHSMHELQRQLLVELTETNSLPRLIVLVDILRKLDTLFADHQISLMNLTKFNSPCDTESEMRAKFLRSGELKHAMNFLETRRVWMQKSIDNILYDSKSIEKFSTLGFYGKVVEILEVRRAALYSIISHFNALFLSNGDKDCSRECRIILQTWISEQIFVILDEVKETIVLLEDGASVCSILEQCIFLSSRLGSLGCDFTLQLTEAFEDVLSRKIQTEFTVSMENFKSMLMTERFNYNGQEQLIPLHVPAFFDGAVVDSSEIPFPQIILNFPPLSYLMNTVLNSINFLRECYFAELYESSLQEIINLTTAITHLIVNSRMDLRERGRKYLEGLKNVGGSQKVVDGTSPSDQIVSHFDILLGHTFCFFWLPHVLLCHGCVFRKIATSEVLLLHDKIFPSQTPSQFPSRASCSSALLKEALGSTTFLELEKVWRIAADAGLIGKEI